jgi:hypothetical protein
LQQYGLKSPVNSVLLALYLQVPVVIGGVRHMVVKRNYLSAFVIPIHLAWFSANKTWRGLVVVPLFTALGGLCMLPLEWLLVQTMGTSLLSQWNLAFLGFIAGIGYVLAELPNSFFKRRMGIQAGEVPEHNKLHSISWIQRWVSRSPIGWYWVSLLKQSGSILLAFQ